MKTIFELRASGEWADEHICERLNNMGYESRAMHRRDKQTGEVIGLTGSKPLSVKQLQRIIRKPIYCGIRVGKWTHGELIKTPFDGLISIAYWMLATSARPSAVMDLQWQQIDFENGIIRLNPAGRKQNKKYRPTVKIPQFMKERYRRDGHYPTHGPVISYCGREVKSVRTAWRRTRDKVGLDKDVNLYSLRHTAARWMRKQGVPAWDVAAQLGHKSREFSMTERYAPYSPDHMEKSVSALNELLVEIST